VPAEPVTGLLKMSEQVEKPEQVAPAGQVVQAPVSAPAAQAAEGWNLMWLIVSAGMSVLAAVSVSAGVPEPAEPVRRRLPRPCLPNRRFLPEPFPFRQIYSAFLCLVARIPNRPLIVRRTGRNSGNHHQLFLYTKDIAL
jgi:hypothetical protein